jgi:hypothetical protein
MIYESKQCSTRIDRIRASKSEWISGGIRDEIENGRGGRGRGHFRHAGEYVLVNECSGDELRSALVRFRKQSVRCSNDIDENADFSLNQLCQPSAHLRQVILPKRV